MDEDKKPEKNLNQRIEDLVDGLENVERVMEKRFSYRASFGRGVLQGLGIVVGSTIVAGILYATLTKFINPNFIDNLTLDSVIEKQHGK